MYFRPVIVIFKYIGSGTSYSHYCIIMHVNGVHYILSTMPMRQPLTTMYSLLAVKDVCMMMLMRSQPTTLVTINPE